MPHRKYIEGTVEVSIMLANLIHTITLKFAYDWNVGMEFVYRIVTEYTMGIYVKKRVKSSGNI